MNIAAKSRDDTSRMTIASFCIGLALAAICASMLVWMNLPGWGWEMPFGEQAGAPLGFTVVGAAVIGTSLGARSSLIAAQRSRLSVAGTVLNAVSFGMMIVIPPGLLRM